MLKLLGSIVARGPWWALTALIVATGVLGVFAAQQKTDTDITSFAAETELSLAFDRIQDDFASGGASAQVIVDAGEDGNVVSAAGVLGARAVRQAAIDDPVVAEALPKPTDSSPPVFSFATPILGAAAQQGLDIESLTDAQVTQLAAMAYGTEQGGAAAGLTSRDRNLQVPAARAGLVIVQFDPDLDEVGQQEASVALRDALADQDIVGVQVDVFSQGILFEELEGGMEEELPMLLGLSLLLIVVILSFIYRSVSDVLIGLVGLVVSIVWMYGFSVLLGPDYLGLVGAFSQIAIVVPVLLVGLGVDYAVHLTARYREERAKGEAPPASARMAVLTVGGALVLATITTLIGFLTNLASPLPPIGDFGVFAAAGVLSSFMVMGLLVPSVRNLLDRRKRSQGRRRRANEVSALARFMGRTAVLTEHAPVITLLAALAITAAAVVASTNVSTEFSQDEFIPEDSVAADLLDTLDSLFGGDVTERSYVLLDGDLADARVANAVLAAEANMAGNPDVRTVEGRPSATSAPSLLIQLAARADAQQPEVADRFSALGLVDAEFESDADMEALYDLARQLAPAAVAEVLAGDSTTGVIALETNAGEDRVEDLLSDLEEDVAPIRAAGVEATVTSQGLVVAEVLDSMTESQTRSIVITLAAALLLLVAYYWVSERRPFLGLVTMVPSMLVVAWTLGTMWLLGLSFNVLTATVASLAIGIGVPYGIHVTHRFMEDRERADNIDGAVRLTMSNTGSALAGAALTTAAGFGVLAFASLRPIQQFGTVTAITITYSLVAAVLVQPSCLVLWDRLSRPRVTKTPAPAPVPASVGRRPPPGRFAVTSVRAAGPAKGPAGTHPPAEVPIEKVPAPSPAPDSLDGVLAELPFTAGTGDLSDNLQWLGSALLQRAREGGLAVLREIDVGRIAGYLALEQRFGRVSGPADPSLVAQVLVGAIAGLAGRPAEGGAGSSWEAGEDGEAIRRTIGILLQGIDRLR